MLQKILTLSLILPALTGPSILSAFSSLKEATTYAQKYPEEIAADNANMFDPNYQTFYKKNKPSLYKRLLQKLSITESKPSLDFAALKQNLNQLFNNRTTQKLNDRYVLLFDGKPQDKIIIWGDLQGAFHSLVRGLNELAQQGIVSDDLSIQKTNYYIVFNGNSIGRTPYNLETIDLIVSLVNKNPDKVFYIQSNYENINFWNKQTLRDQLTILKEDQLNKPTSLAHLIRNFFNTSPLAFYISYKNGAELLRVSGYDTDFTEINEQLMGSLFTQIPANKITPYFLDKKIPVANTARLRVVIKNLEGIINYKKNEGLARLNPRGGARIWAVFSSPTNLHQRINDFFTDAFVILTLGNNLNELTATVYNRDARTNKPFSQGTTFLLASGTEVKLNEQGAFEKKEIVTIGSTLDLSKTVASVGRAVTQGIITALDEVNKTSNKQLNIVILDDGYAPYKTRENIDYLAAKENIRTIILPKGSGNLRASMDLLRTGSITILFPITGAPEFRKADLPGVIHNRPSYRDEVYALIPYLIKKHLVKKFTFFYQDDSYGWGPMEASREIMRAYGIKNWVEIPFQRNSTDVKEAIKKIKESKAEALGLYSVPGTTKQMIRELGVSSLVNTKVFGVSSLVDESFKQYFDTMGLNYLFASSVPNPATSNLPIVQDYRKAITKEGFNISVFSLEGYIGTRLVFEAINNIKGPINHVSIRSFFESLNNFDFYGLKFTFDPATRELTKDVWLDNGKRDWILVSDAEKQFKAEEQAKAALTLSTTKNSQEVYG